MSKSDRVVGLICLAGMLGCRGGKGERGGQLEAMIPLVTAQIGETLLGIPSRSLSNTGEPPILGIQGREQVVLAADEVAFAKIVGEGVRPEDIRRIVGKLSDELNKTLKRRKLLAVAGTFPPQCRESDVPKTVLAAVTPYTLETGSPQAQKEGKGQALLMARLTLTLARTGETLAIREFYTGYTLTSSRVSR
ncbi:hypothetical protein [Armatimonas sp.]|uniref:hypothetical protein n=1 Tax=Armatimonas sp. TaxID=1872638 RepID=UPI00286C2C47|nr:hypothetical protein [Armatimonas sp.]